MSVIWNGEGPPAGFSGWGAGPGPTGLRNSPGVNPKPGFAATSINFSFYVIILTTGVPQRAPTNYVPAGTTVAIRAHNGQAAGNQGLIRLGYQPELLTGTDGDPITPDSEISWPCDNTHEIWVAGIAGDGIRVSVQAGRR